MTMQLDGEIVGPGDPAYDELRRTFAHRGRPELIVRCRSARDVAAALDHARTHRLAVSVRGGGHHAAGFGTNDGGLVVDLSPLDAIELLDRDRRLVRIGGGATWGPVSTALAGHGLALSSGDTADVGVGGLLLGGGIGWLARRYGLALDAIVAAEVVTADGSIVRASDTERPDLFWALRGGGGNFGVVTAFELVAQPVTEVVFGSVRFPATSAADVLRQWARHAAAAPDELTTAVNLLPGDAPVTVQACYAGGDPAAARSALRPLLGAAPELSDDLRTMPYPEILADMPGLPPGFRFVLRSAFVRRITPDLIEELVAAAPTTAVNVRGLGGAVARVAPDATAFGYRDSAALVTLALMGDAETVQRATPALAETWRRIEPFTTGTYSNFGTADQPVDAASSYPAPTLRRLAEVKRELDPGNVFRHNYNIAPARP
ncbi:FAD-linked oxidase [Actinocatenispora thailandica]|uniref:FAD-linked oxidase n=1 Tax=Actinocatenispora thailandica TaxID=227318 RepID=A0A7R7HZQ0_9ACTN|nr:FAD-binding oxidoreductase [Actinocatenispora thailandica]BCJ37761.1 FAD-linked oxidase [Actinocatenispora thailandica]